MTPTTIRRSPTCRRAIPAHSSSILQATCNLEWPHPAKPVSYVVISDIHLGNRQNPAFEIIKNLRTYFGEFKDDTPLIDLDIVFIAGDFFDKALYMSHEDVLHISSFLADLFQWCAYHGIRLRYLEGTPSHDRKQIRAFLAMAYNTLNLDFRYIETMCVEAFTDLEFTCLYVPDEFGGSALNAQSLIQQEYEKLGITKTSCAIMHGMFKFQVPDLGSDRFKFDEQFFLDRVYGFINIGHVHVSSTYGRILAQGSFDRYCHGEESKKGGIFVKVSKDEQSFTFVENKGSMKFVTVHVKLKDMDEATEFVHKKVRDLPAFAHVRIKARQGHPILNVVPFFEQQYQSLIFTRITEEEEKKREQLIDTQEVLNVDYTPISITKDNIVQLLTDEALKRADVHPRVLSKITTTLKELAE